MAATNTNIDNAANDEELKRVDEVLVLLKQGKRIDAMKYIDERLGSSECVDLNLISPTYRQSIMGAAIIDGLVEIPPLVKKGGDINEYLVIGRSGRKMGLRELCRELAFDPSKAIIMEERIRREAGQFHARQIH